MFPIILIAMSLFGVFFYFILKKKKAVKEILDAPFSKEWEELLIKDVQFYKELSVKDKIRFQTKIKRFIGTTTITGVKDLEVTDELKLLVACSAIIPVFKFDGWEYVNLSEVIIYDGAVEPNQKNELSCKVQL